MAQLTTLAVDLIDSANYRTDSEPGAIRQLAEAISAAGRVHSPVRVWQNGTRYVLLAGHHRVAAVRSLGWATIPATVEPRPADEAAHLLEAVADNDTHQPAAPHEQAAAYGALVAAGYDAHTIARTCAKPHGYIARRLELLELDESIRAPMAARGFAWCDSIRGLPPAAQRAAFRKLTDDTTRGQWLLICQRARELVAESSSMFDGAAFDLATETWSTELGAYGTEDATTSGIPPIREPVMGLQEIADRLGVSRDTPSQWRKRGRLPEPDLWASGQPLWWQSTIDEWARATGRTNRKGNLCST